MEKDLFQFPRPLKQLMSPQLWQGVLEAQDQPQVRAMNMLCILRTWSVHTMRRRSNVNHG